MVRQGWRMRQARWCGTAVLGLTGLLLAGCTEYQPVHWGGAVPWEQARRAIYEERGERSRRVPENARHVVMPGETVSELAVLYRVPMAELVALNGIAAPYHIHVGQVLRLPRPQAQPQPARPADGRTHVVARGDTLSGIAAAHNVRLGDVIALNRGIDPARLHVGSTVRLPAGAAPATQVASVAPPQPRATPVAAPVRAAPASQAAPASPVAASRQAPPPPPAGAPAAPRATDRIVAQELPPPAGTPAPRPEPDLAATASTAPATTTSPPPDAARDAARQRDLAAVAAPGLSGDGFLWPVDSGSLISSFGAKPDGRRNDGINIAAPAGSIVRAAENGLVVYADEDLAAFGRMLLVRHADGYLTAYAHNDALLVTRGDVVARGQPIAKVGQSGEVVEPQLHFEIRQGKSAVDPVRLLGDGAVRIAQSQ